MQTIELILEASDDTTGTDTPHQQYRFLQAAIATLPLARVDPVTGVKTVFTQLPDVATVAWYARSLAGEVLGFGNGVNGGEATAEMVGERLARRREERLSGGQYQQQQQGHQHQHQNQHAGGWSH